MIDEVREAPQEKWLSANFLFRIADGPMGELSHGYIMEKGKLQKVALEVMREYGLDENNFKSDFRPDHDAIDFKTIRGYSTEYRAYPTRFNNLFFERDFRVEGDRASWVLWDVRKSSVYYPESMPRVT